MVTLMPRYFNGAFLARLNYASFSLFYSYGLLGASGCGKTTLLTCIVGRRKVNSGNMWVLGGRPGEEDSGVPGPRVGYMPQVIFYSNGT